MWFVFGLLRKSEDLSSVSLVSTLNIYKYKYNTYFLNTVLKLGSYSVYIKLFSLAVVCCLCLFRLPVQLLCV